MLLGDAWFIVNTVNMLLMLDVVLQPAVIDTRLRERATIME